MIDDKKIKDVAKLHAEKSYISDYFQACYKDGFIDCAKNIKKLLNGSILMIYFQRKEVINEIICI